MMIDGEVAMFEVSTAVTVKITFLYRVTPCSLGDGNDLPVIRASRT
jgi:hypothetical protein